MSPAFFVSASSAVTAAFLGLSVVAVPAVHGSSVCAKSFAFVGRDPGQQGTGEDGCDRSKAEEQLQPRTDARRLAARYAATVLVLQPLGVIASAQSATRPAKQSRERKAVSGCNAQQPRAARFARRARAGQRRRGSAGRVPAIASARAGARVVAACTAERKTVRKRKLMPECFVQQRRGLRTGWRQNGSAERLPATAGARVVAACVAVVRRVDARRVDAFRPDARRVDARPNSSARDDVRTYVRTYVRTFARSVVRSFVTYVSLPPLTRRSAAVGTPPAECALGRHIPPAECALGRNVSPAECALGR